MDVGKLLQYVQEVGCRLVEAQPREQVIANIIRRVLGLIRDEAKEDRAEDSSDSARGTPQRKDSIPGPAMEKTLSSSGLRFSSGLSGTSNNDVFTARSSRPPMMTSHTSYAVLNGVPVAQSMFNLLSAVPSPIATPPGSNSPGRSHFNPSSLASRIELTTTDLKAEILSGIEEIIDELDQVDDQIAAYAHEQIHSGEVILTHSSSRSVQRFLLKAAADKRKFTVIIAESFPNDHEITHKAVTGKMTKAEDNEDMDDMDTPKFMKPLTAAGITVVLMPDAGIFSIMSNVNKVILATHAVIANGGLIAAAGSRMIAKAAKANRRSVIVISGVYKLSPDHPFEHDSLIEYGDPSRILDYHDGLSLDNLEIENPVYDYVPPELVDLYITNL